MSWQPPALMSSSLSSSLRASTVPLLFASGSESRQDWRVAEQGRSDRSRRGGPERAGASRPRAGGARQPPAKGSDQRSRQQRGRGPERKLDRDSRGSSERPEHNRLERRGDRQRREASERTNRPTETARPGLARRKTEPPVPEGVDSRSLHAAVRAELRGLPKELAEIVAAHLVVAGQLIDDDPGAGICPCRGSAPACCPAADRP